jgi:hypothetical protein
MRLQIVLNDQEEQTLEWLEKITGCRTHKDLFDNGMTLLHWAVEQRLQNRTVASFDSHNKTYRELQMPALQHAASMAPRLEREKREQATASRD